MAPSLTEIQDEAKRLAWTTPFGKRLVRQVRARNSGGLMAEPTVLVELITGRKTSERETLALIYTVHSGLSTFLQTQNDFRRPVISFATLAEVSRSHTAR